MTTCLMRQRPWHNDPTDARFVHCCDESIKASDDWLPAQGGADVVIESIQRDLYLPPIGGYVLLFLPFVVAAVTLAAWVAFMRLL